VLTKYLTRFLALIIAFTLTLSMAIAGNTDDLTGSTLIVSHDWKKSTGEGEIHFGATEATGGGDFKRIGKIRREGDTLTIRLSFYLFGKSRASRLTWVKGSPTAVVKIIDCKRNCRNEVRIKYLKGPE